MRTWQFSLFSFDSAPTNGTPYESIPLIFLQSASKNGCLQQNQQKSRQWANEDKSGFLAMAILQAARQMHDADHCQPEVPPQLG